MKLEALNHPGDAPQLVRDACFYVGWQLRSPDSWGYIDIFTQNSGTVTLPELIKAVETKRDRLNPKAASINKFAQTRK